MVNIDRATMTIDGKDVRDLALEHLIYKPSPAFDRSMSGQIGSGSVSYNKELLDRALTGDPGCDYYTSVTGIPVVEGSPYWDTVAGDPPLTPFDVDAIIEEVRKFIDGIDAHLLSVDQRLKHYRKQRGE